MQTALSDHMSSHSELGDVLGLAATLVKATAEVVGFFDLPADVVGNLQRARVLGKRAIGVNFAIKEISKVPASPELIPKHAETIVMKLAQRGIGPKKVELPGFLSRVLTAMQQVKATPAVSAGEPVASAAAA